MSTLITGAERGGVVAMETERDNWLFDSRFSSERSIERRASLARLAPGSLLSFSVFCSLQLALRHVRASESRRGLRRAMPADETRRVA